MRLVDGRGLSPEAQSRVTQLCSESPSSSLAVLCYRLDPELRHFSLALKGYNENFLLLHDTAETSGADLTRILVTAPMFRHEDSMQAYETGMQRFYDVIYSLFSGDTVFTANVRLHISRLGRASTIFEEFFLLGMQQYECEFALRQQALPSSLASTPILHVRSKEQQQVPSSPQAQKENTSPSPYGSPTGEVLLKALAAASEALLWESEGVPQEKRSKNSKRFKCDICGAKNTIQARRGPRGPGTLCNRCGLRWRKTTQAAAAQTSEPSPEAEL